MDWRTLRDKLGILGSVLLLTLPAVLVSVFVSGIAWGLGLKNIYIPAVLTPLMLIPALVFLLLALLEQLEESELEVQRKSAQVYALQKELAANQDAEKDQLIKDLNSFAQTVAHDLKTPLTTILGFASMLADHQANIPRQQQREALQAIVRTSIKMNNIIQELMLLAAVRQDEVKIGAMEMPPVIEAARQRLWGILADSQAQIKVLEAAAMPKVLGYAPWVEEVWINYISNAIKYGGSPAEISIGAEEAPQPSPAGQAMVRFWVKDNGKGIDPQDQKQLFTQFTRLDQVRAEGHGLGLSIVARIVQKLGGEVGVESQPGEGSLFYFTLPALKKEPITRARPQKE